MTRTTLLAVLLLAGTASVGRAQQAAIPTPHPLPQSTTDCRGCSDNNDDKKPAVGKYDEKKPGTVRAGVKPDAKPSTTSAKKKSSAKKSRHKHLKARPALKAKPDTARK